MRAGVLEDLADSLVSFATEGAGADFAAGCLGSGECWGWGRSGVSSFFSTLASSGFLRLEGVESSLDASSLEASSFGASDSEGLDSSLDSSAGLSDFPPRSSNVTKRKHEAARRTGLSTLFDIEEILSHSDGIFFRSIVFGDGTSKGSVDRNINLHRQSWANLETGHLRGERELYLVSLDGSDLLVGFCVIAFLLEPLLQSSFTACVVSNLTRFACRSEGPT
jgi:hypothetical protein